MCDFSKIENREEIEKQAKQIVRRSIEKETLLIDARMNNQNSTFINTDGIVVLTGDKHRISEGIKILKNNSN